MIREIGLQALKERILDRVADREAPASFILIEATSPTSWENQDSICLPGAIRMSQAEAEDWLALENPPRALPVILYDEGMPDTFAHRIARYFETQGFSELWIFTGGKVEWNSAGLPVESYLDSKRDREKRGAA